MNTFQVSQAAGSPAPTGPAWLQQSRTDVSTYYQAMPQHILAEVNWASAAGLIFAGIICAILVAKFFLSSAAE